MRRGGYNHPPAAISMDTAGDEIKHDTIPIEYEYGAAQRERSRHTQDPAAAPPG